MTECCLVVLGILAGLSLGWAIFSPSPLAAAYREIDEQPRDLPQTTRYQARASELVRALVPDGNPQLEVLVDQLAREAWGHGVSDLRDELVASSGLPPSMADHMCSIAITEVTRRG